MKTVVYAIGQRFNSWFSNPDFCAWLIENGVEIIGVADGNNALQGTIVKCCNKNWEVNLITEYSLQEVDAVIVTSDVYFAEIRERLEKHGYSKEAIQPLEQFIVKYIDKIYSIGKISGKSGVEIGGPSQIFAPIYECCNSCDGVNYSKDTVWWKDEGKYCFGQKLLGETIIADATDLQEISDCTYDFVLSSNNLEHIANPLKALNEFKRICKKTGIIFILVPRKEETFDHNRECTSFEHILEDFENNIQEDDLTHLPEILLKHDYDMDWQCKGKENFILRSKDNFYNRCLHHHVFNKECLRKMYEYIGLEVLELSQHLGNWLIVGCVRE